jgi:hypothetical protein
MSVGAKGPVPSTGRIQHVFAAVGAWPPALDFTGTDYAFDRIQHLEEEVAALKRKLPPEGSVAPSDGRPH